MRLRFPYSRPGRPPRVRLVEVVNPTTIFLHVIHFQNGGRKSKSEPCCVLLAFCGCFTEEKREKRTSKAQILGSEGISEERRAGNISYSCTRASSSRQGIFFQLGN